MKNKFLILTIFAGLTGSANMEAVNPQHPTSNTANPRHPKPAVNASRATGVIAANPNPLYGKVVRLRPPLTGNAHKGRLHKFGEHYTNPQEAADRMAFINQRLGEIRDSRWGSKDTTQLEQEKASITHSGILNQ